MKKSIVLSIAAGLVLSAIGGASATPKNVILMISDGWGYNQIAATNYYSGSTASYQGSDFVKYGMKTNSANNPAGYDPAQAWVGGNPNKSYLSGGATDSASAITAMLTGVKNYDGQVNWSTSGQKLTSFAESYKAAGKAAGAVTTVEWSHATPAGVYAHNSNRNNYSAIANEGVYGNMDVIMGAGNPDYDNNGNPSSKNAQYVGGSATWNNLKNNNIAGVTHIQNRSEFQALATGDTPDRVIGTFKAYETAQAYRSGDTQTVHPETLNAGVPTLAEMSLGALNVLDNNANGFFVMIEGGAVDWANHSNQKGRLIEEQQGFNAAVDSVIDYINTKSSWEDTLLIVTGDHETGLLLGPNGETDIVDNGSGIMPGMSFYSGGHSNSLIPLFAKGSGSELFAQYATGVDPVHGSYIDNTDIYKVMNQATAVPEPATLLGFGVPMLMIGLGKLKGLRK
jgi:alkaline phosphatase